MSVALPQVSIVSVRAGFLREPSEPVGRPVQSRLGAVRRRAAPRNAARRWWPVSPRRSVRRHSQPEVGAAALIADCAPPRERTALVALQRAEFLPAKMADPRRLERAA